MACQTHNSRVDPPDIDREIPAGNPMVSITMHSDARHILRGIKSRTNISVLDVTASDCAAYWKPTSA